MKTYSPLSGSFRWRGRNREPALGPYGLSSGHRRQRRSRRLVMVAALAGLTLASSAVPAGASPSPLGSEGPLDIPRVAADASPASFPGANGRIAFHGYINRLPETYTIRPNGSGLRRITHNTDYDSDPAWSPAADRIAFNFAVPDSDVNPDIWIMDADGSSRSRVTRSKSVDFGPTWSPSGEWIAYAAFLNEPPEIYIIRPDGTGRLQVTHNKRPDLYPSWSPSGEWIVYSGFDGNDLEIFVIRPESAAL